MRKFVDRYAILLLVIIGLGVYLNSLWNPFIWDDFPTVIDNIFIKNFSLINIFSKDLFAGSGDASNWYRPILAVSYALDYSVWKLIPFGYHLTNVLIHIGSGLIIYLITRKFIENKTLPFLGSLFFLIHPVQTEAVSYISGRTDLLFTFFILLSLWLMQKFYFEKIVRKKRIYYFLSVLSFVGSLLSKETAIIFPFMLVIFYFAFLNKRIDKESIKETIGVTVPFFVILIFYIVSRFTVFNFYNVLTVSQDQHVYSLSLLKRSLVFLKALFAYLSVLIFPLDLHYRTQTMLSVTNTDPQVLFALGFVGTCLFLIYKWWQDNREISFGILWLLIGLVPVSGILFSVNYAIGLRWLYFPLAGLSISIPFLFTKIKSLDRGKLNGVLICFFAFYLVFFAIITIKRNPEWGNPILFFSQILKYDSENYRIHTQLGVSLVEQGLNDEALKEFKISIRLEPSLATNYFNMALIYKNNKDYKNAIIFFEKAADKNFPTAYTELASIYVQEKQYDKAIEWLEKLRILFPGSWKVYSLMGDVYYFQGDYLNTRQSWTKALILDPNNVDVKKKLLNLPLK